MASGREFSLSAAAGAPKRIVGALFFLRLSAILPAVPPAIG
jgi:hypothetical protein